MKLRLGPVWLCLGMVFCAVGAKADTSSSIVVGGAIAAGAAEYMVPANSSGWFDVGGYCKVVDVGNTVALPDNRAVNGLPVFTGSTAAEWDNWRATAPGEAGYDGLLNSTTCCRPQNGIATLCAGASNATAVSRQYGRLNEVDTVSMTCSGAYGQYTESVHLTCSGSNAANGQASWTGSAVSDVCTNNAETTYGACSTAGIGGWGTQSVTVYNSCGGVQSTSSQACYVTPPCTPNAYYSACTYACGGGTQYVYDSCGNITGQQACNTQSCCQYNYGWTKESACICSGGHWEYNQQGYYCINTSTTITVYDGCGNVISTSYGSCGVIYENNIPGTTCNWNTGQGSGVCGAGMGPGGDG